MIFLVVTSNFSADVQTDDADVAEDASGKPNVTDVSGDAQYYVMPVANLHKVTVNGVDRSDTIAGSAVGVLGKVIDQGQVTIKPGEIEIQTPAGVSPDEAVQRPEL
ncbi:biopolymer transporter ExbD [uncultured Methanobrevibacter sp.]|uniref:biopolymer transporter ExbD n=1 Tax=uncultured Methanobrevibacter sp. TaxID=253161 RepID=UPI00262B0C4D|nr:biopolymer transporter ExbD [uncultured Methanobrevibacter sp.]